MIAAAVPAYGQALGDLARQEEARRAAAQKAVKTLSNADLKPSEIAPPAGAATAATDAAAAPSCYMSKSQGRCASAEELVAASTAGALTKENAPYEETFRREAGSIRSQIEKTQASIATLERVVADAGRSASDRNAAEKALAGARQAIAGLEREWEKLERAVSNQRFPRKWIEPIPTLTTVKQ